MTNTSYIIPTGGQEMLFGLSPPGQEPTSPRTRYLNHVNHNNNNIGSLNFSHKYVNKFGDIVRGDHSSSGYASATGDQLAGRNNRRVRHFSQQQSPSVLDKEASPVVSDKNRINQTRHSISNDLPLKNGLSGQCLVGRKQPEIDVTIPIGSYDNEHHSLYLMKQIEATLKQAKENKTFPCTEILIPQQLISQIAQDIIVMAATEPCGLRGCLLYVNIEEKTVCRRLGEVKLGDTSTVATFEMHLTLKRASSSWLDAVESKLFGKESVVLSNLYKLSKKKLFRSLSSP